MVNRSVPYILTVAIGLILGFCAYHFLMPVPTKLVENTRTVSIIDTVYAKGKDSIVYRTRWSHSESKGVKQVDTLIFGKDYHAKLHIDTLKWSLDISVKSMEITKWRVDTLKIKNIDSVFIKLPADPLRWYEKPEFVAPAAFVFGIAVMKALK